MFLIHFFVLFQNIFYLFLGWWRRHLLYFTIYDTDTQIDKMINPELNMILCLEV